MRALVLEPGLRRMLEELRRTTGVKFEDLAFYKVR
jgi:hypothetical protein